MAESITIARPYAEAAFKLAHEKNALAQWSQMLQLLETVVKDERVASRIKDPNVSGHDLEGLLLGVGGDSLDAMGRNFVQVLVRNHRLELLPEIHRLFEELKREEEGVLEAQIASAFDMDDQQKSQLVQRLEAKYKRKVSAAFSVDRELIGGVKIVVGDKVLDATVRGRLDAMAAALTH